MAAINGEWGKYVCWRDFWISGVFQRVYLPSNCSRIAVLAPPILCIHLGLLCCSLSFREGLTLPSERASLKLSSWKHTIPALTVKPQH